MAPGADCRVYWGKIRCTHLALEEEGLQVSRCKAYFLPPAQNYYLLTLSTPILQANKMRCRKGD